MDRMLPVLIAAAVVAFLLWRSRGRLAPGRWRIGAGVVSIGGLVAGLLLAIRGEWELGLPLASLSLGGLFAARAIDRTRRTQRPAAADALTAEQARSVLGVADTASPGEIRAAYSRLMRMVHPDHGGTNGLAAQLNAARDRLLKG
jgi:hypothetical protein